MRKPAPEEIQLPQDGSRFLPHRPPMLLVDELLERSGNMAVGSAVVPEGGVCCGGKSGFPELFVEIIAQTVAMANGYDAFRNGEKIREGMLVGIDSFSIAGTAELGRMLRIVTEKTFEFGAVRIIHGDVFCDGKLVAQGDIKVWENPGS